MLGIDDGFFSRGSPVAVVAVCVVLVGVILAADLATGPHLSLSVFYLVPPALATWRLGRIAGVFAGAATGLTWTIADTAAGVYGSDRLAPYWNVTVRFALMVAVSTLLAQLRPTMRSHERMTLEAVDAADELRSLNALKDTLLHAVSHDLR